MPLCFWPGGEAATPDAKHPGKARESSAGESLLSPSDVPGLSWARSPQTFRHHSAAGGVCMFHPTTLFFQLRVQGGHRPGAGLGARSPQSNILCAPHEPYRNYLENSRFQVVRKFIKLFNNRGAVLSPIGSGNISVSDTFL